MYEFLNKLKRSQHFVVLSSRFILLTFQSKEVQIVTMLHSMIQNV